MDTERGTETETDTDTTGTQTGIAANRETGQTVQYQCVCISYCILRNFYAYEGCGKNMVNLTKKCNVGKMEFEVQVSD